MCAQPAPEKSGILPSNTATPPDSTGVAAAPPQRQRPGITPIQWVGLAVLVLLVVNQTGLLTSAGGLTAYVQDVLPRLIALLLAITVHEFSHGLVATLFGDPTPRLAGRLTLNPLRHLDPIGTIMILIRAPIGWGRPMPINPAAMRNPNIGWALSSLAGPVSNILAAYLMVILLTYVSGLSDRSIFPYINDFISINVFLAVFNLLPVPPLDGFGFVFGLSPRPLKIVLLPLQRYGPIILLAMLFLGQPLLTAYLRGGAEIVNSFLLVLAGGA